MNSEAVPYLAAARKMPTLDREQEIELLRRVQLEGDRKAADKIARAYQWLVVSFALRFRRYNVSLADLVAEGNVGLLRAMGKFDVDRGVRFGTYAAYWLRAHMLTHVIQSRSVVGGAAGVWHSKMFFRVRRERARVANHFGTGEAADRVLAERLGVSLERVQGMLHRLDNPDVSIDGGTSSGTSLLDRLQTEANQEEELFKRQFDCSLETTIQQALGALDARERFIIQKRAMASEPEAPSLAELARNLGISRERARQLENRAMNKLRRAVREAKCPALDDWIRNSNPWSTRSNRPGATPI